MSTLSLLGRCGVNNIILSLCLFKMHACKARRSWDSEYDDDDDRKSECKAS